LKRHGWSCQVPVRHAIERDEEAIEMWKDEVWPRLKGPRRTWAPISASRTRQARGCQGVGAAAVGSLQSHGLGPNQVPGLNPEAGQVEQGVGLAVVCGLAVQGLGPLDVPSLPSQIGQELQGIGAAVGGGTEKELVGPLEAVPSLCCPGEVVEVGGVGEVDVGGVPEGCGWAEAAAGRAAVLFEVVGEPETPAPLATVLWSCR
ncbi:winged helix-turn-helix domain-containing protein, partial [Streptomyces antibioticus]